MTMTQVRATANYLYSHESRVSYTPPHSLPTYLYSQMTSRLAPVAKPIFRAQLCSKQSTTFVPQIRKLVFEFAQNWSSSANTRTYLQNNLQTLARANPHVEVVVRQRNNRQPIVRGFYRACSSSYSRAALNSFRPAQSMTTRRSFL